MLAGVRTPTNSPILRQLHLLPVRRRVYFKIAVLVFQCLTGQAPGYLAEDCQLVADVSARRLRSAYTATCVQHLRRPMLRSCRSTAMELAANQSKTVSQSGTIQAFAEDIPV